MITRRKRLSFLFVASATVVVALFWGLVLLGMVDSRTWYRTVQAAGGDSSPTQGQVGGHVAATVRTDAHDAGGSPAVAIVNRPVVSETALVTITVSIPVTTVQTGEHITVTVEVDNQPRDCSYLMYDLTLEENGSPALFEFVSPQRLGPPAPSTAEYILRALHAGSTSLRAVLFGEDFCGFYSWSYRYGYSSHMTVEGETVLLTQFLPLITR